jgi:hypothetical protein
VTDSSDDRDNRFIQIVSGKTCRGRESLPKPWNRWDDILKCIVKNWSARHGNGLIWLRIGTRRRGFCEDDNELSVSLKCEEFT